MCSVCLQAEGGALVHHHSLDRDWLGVRQAHSLRQRQEDLHDRHPSSGKVLPKGLLLQYLSFRYGHCSYCHRYSNKHARMPKKSRKETALFNHFVIIHF